MKCLSFKKAEKLLLKYKIPFCRTAVAASREEAGVFAKKFGYPVVLKVFAPEVMHKTDLGLVEIGIRGEKELEAVWNKLSSKIKKRKIKEAEILIQKQLFGTETVAGMKRDGQFGPVLMFGLGGVLIEVLADVSFRIAPVGRKEAGQMTEEIKGYRILKRFRSQKAVNLAKLAGIIVSLSQLALKEKKIIEADLNPIIANEKGSWVADPRFLIHDQ
ncbi:MAG: acetate--CoA ligase family protein [Candidatus Nealsonbacteria bacterium]